MRAVRNGGGMPVNRGGRVRRGSAVMAAMPSAPVRRIPRTDEEIERAAAEDDDARLATAEELADARRAYQTPGKVQITLRLDAAVVDAYKATGKGWQTRLTAVLVADVAIRTSDDIADALERAAQQALALATKLRIASHRA